MLKGTLNNANQWKHVLFHQTDHSSIQDTTYNILSAGIYVLIAPSNHRGSHLLIHKLRTILKGYYSIRNIQQNASFSKGRHSRTIPRCMQEQRIQQRA